MTSSYLEPVDTTEAAGVKLTADYTDSQAENQRRNEQNLTAEFQRIGDQYNRMYSAYAAGKGYTDLLNLTDSGLKLKNELDELAVTRKRIKNFKDSMKKNRAMYTNATTYKDLVGYDPEVAALNREDSNMDLYRQELNNAQEGEENFILDPTLIAQVHDNETLQQAKESLPLFITTVQGSVHVNVGTEENPQFMTLEDAQSSEHVKAVTDELIAIHAHINRDLVGSSGRFKRDYLADALDIRDKLVLEKRKQLALASAEATKTESLKDLAYTVKNRGPQYAIDYINIYRGSFGSHALARKAMIQKLHDSAAQGYLTEGDVDKIIKHKFLAHDSTPEKPHWTSIEEYWPKDAATLRKGVRAYQTGQVNEATENDKAKQDFWVHNRIKELRAQKEPITIDQRNKLQQDFSTEFGIFDPAKIPSEIRNLEYAGVADDAELDRLFTHALANGHALTEKDIMSLTDPALKLKYRKVMAQRGGALDSRADFLKKAVDGHFNNKLGEAGRGTTDWFFTHAAAAKAYQTKYDEVIEQTGSHAQAESAAFNAVQSLLDADAAGKIDLSQRVDIPIDESIPKDILKTSTALQKNPNLINSETLMPGEKAHLEQAAKYLKQESKIFPHFYTRLAPYTGMNRHQLIRHRLKLAGLLKDGEVTLPEEEVLNTSQMRRIKYGSPGSAYQIIQETGEDASKLLTTVQDETAQAGAGYDHVRNNQGEIVELEKPLSQHTVGELIALLGEGYSDFGMYGISNTDLREILGNMPVGIDEVFDQDAQDLLVLARLRYKAQKAQQYCTVNSDYRRTVNINRNDSAEFNSIVGDLPPYLRLENMLAACSTELIKQTLQ